MADDPQIASKIISAMPREISNVYLVEWNNAEVKTPLPGQEFKIDLPVNPYLAH